MTVKYKGSVQRLRTQYVEYEYTDALTATFLPLIRVPPGAIVVSGFSTVLTASNGGTSDVIDVGVSGTANKYLNDDDAKTQGITALVPTGLPNSGGEVIGVTRTEGGTAATAGKFGLLVTYVIPGSSDFTQD